MKGDYMNYKIYKLGRITAIESADDPMKALRARYIIGAQELKHGRPDDIIVEPPVEELPPDRVPGLPSWVLDVYRRHNVTKAAQAFLAEGG